MFGVALAAFVEGARAAPLSASSGEVVALPTLGVTAVLPPNAAVHAGPERVDIDLGPLDSVWITRLAVKPSFAQAVSDFVTGVHSVRADQFGDGDYRMEGDGGYGQVEFYLVRSLPIGGVVACGGRAQQSTPGDPSLERVKGVCASIALPSKP